MGEKKKKPIHIVKVRIRNIHRLEICEAEIKAGGGIVRVTGRNKAGKSSVLRAFRMALGGAKQTLKNAVRKGAASKSGSAVLELSNGYTVDVVVKEGGQRRLKVKGPDKGSYGQSLLTEWLGDHHDFDLLNFFALKVARQIAILFSLSKDPDLSTTVDLARVRAAKHYVERTPHLSEQTRCRKIEEPYGERPEEVDTAVEMARLKELQDAETQRDETIGALAANRLSNEVQRGEVDRLTQELALHQSKLAAVEARGVELSTQLDEMPDVADDLAAVEATIQSAADVSKWLEPWKEYDRAQALLKSSGVRVEELTELIETARREEREAIAGAGIPVQGLTFDPETTEPLLNGLSLEVASGAEKIRMALDVAVAADPDLKIILVDEANDLDSVSLESLDEESKARGFQVWCCRIDEDNPGEIVVVDGVAGVESQVAF